MSGYFVRMIPKIQKWWEEIHSKSDNLIDKEISKLNRIDRDNEEILLQTLKQLRQKSNIVRTVQDFEDLLDLLEENKRPLPAKFASKNGEIISDLGYKVGNKEVEVHHGHVTVMNKLNTLYWIHSPKDNKIIILALLEEHPKNNRGYSKKELLKRLPKNIPDDLLNSEDETAKENYPETLKIKEKRLTRISTGKYRVGAIYRENKTNNYFLLLNYVNFTYVIIKLDDLTRDKEVLSTSSILDLLDYHKNDLFLYDRELESLTKLDYFSARKLLSRSLYISYNSDESLRDLLLIFDEIYKDLEALFTSHCIF